VGFLGKADAPERNAGNAAHDEDGADEFDGVHSFLPVDYFLTTGT
jgi:hypothetical protein